MARLQRTSERAFILPIAGFIVFVPPILTLFDGPEKIAGIPLILLYMFGAWLLLIYAGRRLAQRLLSGARRAPPEDRAGVSDSTSVSQRPRSRP